MTTYRPAAAGLAYVATVVAANTLTATFGLVPIGFRLLVTAGTFAAGLSLVARDWVQVTSPAWAVPALIAVASVVSAVTATPALALASGVAFLVAELEPLIRICLVCPVRVACLDYAIAAQVTGVWGGTSSNQRARFTGHAQPGRPRRR